jgi:hypothetical protein
MKVYHARKKKERLADVEDNVEEEFLDVTCLTTLKRQNISMRGFSRGLCSSRQPTSNNSDRTEAEWTVYDTLNAKT